MWMLYSVGSDNIFYEFRELLKFRQSCILITSYERKYAKQVVKIFFRKMKNYYLKLMHPKSGWVARSLAKKKGKQI